MAAPRYDQAIVVVQEAKDLPERRRMRPYVRTTATFTNQSYQTRVLRDSRAPVWNEDPVRLFFPVADGQVKFQVFSKEKFPRRHDYLLGECNVPIAQLQVNQPSDRWVDLSKGGALHLRLNVEGSVPPPVKNSPRLEEKYEMGKMLGKGGFSEVFQASHRATGTQVAVKVIDLSNARDTEKAVLHREIEVMKKLVHPHIVQLLDLYETSDVLQLVLELVPGGELFDQIIARGRFPEAEAADLVRQVCQAVLYMHDNGICHRDLKPENLLLAGDAKDIIKVADFGLSKDFGASAMQTSLGTPAYVAPEVLTGLPYDKQVDMWSIGVIAYVLLCGFTPFWAEDKRVLFEQIIAAKVTFPSPEWDTVSEAAKDLVKRLLVANADKRLTARAALDHAWLRNVPDREAKTGRVAEPARKEKEPPREKEELQEYIILPPPKQASPKSPAPGRAAPASPAGRQDKEKEREKEKTERKSREEDKPGMVSEKRSQGQVLARKLADLEAKFDRTVSLLQTELAQLRAENVELRASVQLLMQNAEF